MFGKIMGSPGHPARRLLQLLRLCNDPDSPHRGPTGPRTQTSVSFDEADEENHTADHFDSTKRPHAVVVVIQMKIIFTAEDARHFRVSRSFPVHGRLLFPSFQDRAHRPYDRWWRGRGTRCSPLRSAWRPYLPLTAGCHQSAPAPQQHFAPVWLAGLGTLKKYIELGLGTPPPGITRLSRVASQTAP